MLEPEALNPEVNKATHRTPTNSTLPGLVLNHDGHYPESTASPDLGSVCMQCFPNTQVKAAQAFRSRLYGLEGLGLRGWVWRFGSANLRLSDALRWPPYNTAPGGMRRLMHLSLLSAGDPSPGCARV